MINNKNKFLSYEIKLNKFEAETGQNEYQKDNYTNSIGKYTFPVQNIIEV